MVTYDSDGKDFTFHFDEDETNSISDFYTGALAVAAAAVYFVPPVAALIAGAAGLVQAKAAVEEGLGYCLGARWYNQPTPTGRARTAWRGPGRYVDLARRTPRPKLNPTRGAKGVAFVL